MALALILNSCNHSITYFFRREVVEGGLSQSFLTSKSRLTLTTGSYFLTERIFCDFSVRCAFLGLEIKFASSRIQPALINMELRTYVITTRFDAASDAKKVDFQADSTCVITNGKRSLSARLRWRPASAPAPQPICRRARPPQWPRGRSERRPATHPVDETMKRGRGAHV